MNLPQLGQYSEDLGKMLRNSIELKRALTRSADISGSSRRPAPANLRHTLQKNYGTGRLREP
jgi:hypothetical protein